MNINNDAFNDIRPLLQEICAKTGASEEEVFRTVSRITPETSMKSLAALERNATVRPRLVLIAANDEGEDEPK